MKNLFIGIDFSKEKFDASFFVRDKQEDMKHMTFENNDHGFKAFFSWLKCNSGVTADEWLFCGEHTGVYSLSLSAFILKKGLFMWLENPMQIKKSSGIKREKTDRVDSQQIALYAWRFEDRAKAYELPGKTMSALKLLIAHRDRLLRAKVSLLIAAKETRRVMKRDATARFIYEDTRDEVAYLNKKISKVEKLMEKKIREDKEVEENYRLAISVKGIGMINAVAIIVATNNFARFDHARQFACYCGVVPFEKSSGSSVRGGKHISRIANIQLKTYLTQAARSAVLYDWQLKDYYNRKKKEGKKDQLIINNVRNKLLERVFAVVRRKKPFEKNYINYLCQSA